MLNVKTVNNLNSLVEVDALFEKAQQEGLTSIGITDDGSLHHLYAVSKQIKKTGIQAVVGAKFSFDFGTFQAPLALYPKTNRAKEILMMLSSGYFEKKSSFKIKKAGVVLQEMNVVIDTKELTVQDITTAIHVLSEIIEKQFIHVGLHETFDFQNKEMNLKIKEVLEKTKIGYVAFNEILYLNEEEFDTYNHLMAIKEKPKKDDIDNLFLNQEDLEYLFEYMSGVSENTKYISVSSKVSYKLDDSKMKMPAFKSPKNFRLYPLFQKRFVAFIKKSSKPEIKSAAYLTTLVIEGIIEKYGKNRKAMKRALYELDTIINKGFSDYFLIVADAIYFTRKRGGILGPGRGSVVGSIVAYALGITQVCPLKYNLQFERFLNKFRMDWPDIDIDISQKTRKIMLKYLKEKYGEDCVSHIVTKMNYGFSNSVSKLLSKSFRVPSKTVDKMMEFKPESYNSYEDFLLNSSDEAVEFVKSNKDVELLLFHAFALKNIPHAFSKHAAGIIVSNKPLKRMMPMMYDHSGVVTSMTQFTNDDGALEEMGLLKIDVLGVRTLDVNQETREMSGSSMSRDYTDESVDDENVLKLFKEGHLSGVFQMESAGMRRSASKIQIDNFSEIVILNAMYRPGPMAMIPTFAERKGQPLRIYGGEGQELSGVEELYPILEETNGIIVYQEQINEISRVWAGYDLARAEFFRKSISKKNKDVLVSERTRFLEMSVDNGREMQTSEDIFNLILKFADFGFNRSHAVAYSFISFETARLKAKHPKEFLSSLLNSHIGESKKIATYIEEARRLNVAIERPDVNLSSWKFELGNEGIRCALPMISEIGIGTGKKIIEARGDVPFKSLQDFMERANVDKRVVENLILAGAMDSLGERSELLAELTGEEISPMNIGDKALLELNKCQTFFSISPEIKSKFESEAKNNSKSMVGIAKKVDEFKDKNKKDMARIELIGLDGLTYKYVIFSSLWKSVNKNIKAGAVIAGEIDKNAYKKVKAVQL